MSTKHLSYEFAYHPCDVHPDGSGRIKRPMMPFSIVYKDEKVDTMGLLDSGADFSSIPLDLALGLNIKIDGLKRDKTSGIAGETDIAWVDLEIEFGQRGVLFKYVWPFQIILSERSELSILGRYLAC